MAIASFLVQAAASRLASVAEAASGLAGVSVAEGGDDSNLVILAEAPAAELPGLEGRLRMVDGVLSVTAVMLSIEDELAMAPEDAARR